MSVSTSRASVCWCLLLVLSATGCGKPAGSPAEAAVVAAIRKLGGKVEFDEKQPDHPVLKVYLHRTDVMDSDLAEFPKLTRLQNLFLGQTKITDTGLEHLKGMIQLQTLSLNGTSVTDAGLVSLSTLTGLKTLNLQETKTTTAGVDELRRVLRTAMIAR
jgi:hypothetical protein